MSRYYLVAEYRAVCLRTLSDMVGRCSSKLRNPDRQCPMIRKDEADIKSLIDMMENNWLNTIYPDESELVSLSTGSVAHRQWSRIFSEHSKWESRRNRHLNGPYQTMIHPPSAKFHDKMTKLRLKTFSTISTNTSRMKSQNMVLRADRNRCGGAAVHTRRRRHPFAFACAACARTGSKAVIVTAEDTDVMLLCIAFQKDIPCPIYQMCVTQNHRTRFVDISKLTWPLGDIICGSLIRLHAVTP